MGFPPFFCIVSVIPVRSETRPCTPAVPIFQKIHPTEEGPSRNRISPSAASERTCSASRRPISSPIFFRRSTAWPTSTSSASSRARPAPPPSPSAPRSCTCSQLIADHIKLPFLSGASAGYDSGLEKKPDTAFRASSVPTKMISSPPYSSAYGPGDTMREVPRRMATIVL